MLCIKLHYVKYMKKIKIKMKNKANKKKPNRTQEHFQQKSEENHF